MSYQISSIRTIENYRDRNYREKAANKIPKPVSLPFPFLRMEPGQFFDLTIKPSELESTRVMLHQNARAAQIWIKTFVKTQNKYELVLTVIHDGKRGK